MCESKAKLEGSFFDMSLSMLSRERGELVSVYVHMVPCTPISYVASSSSEAGCEYVG